MRIAVGLLACLGAAALTSALADPSTETAPAATAAPASPAAATPAPAADSAAATQVITAKAELDRDTAHFVAEGYKPEMRNGTKVWCRREGELGSRLGGQKVCGTPQELNVVVRENQELVKKIQQTSIGPSGK